MSLSTSNFSLSLIAGQTVTIAGQIVTFQPTSNITASLVDGTGDSQANTVVALQPTITAAANQDYDLTAITGGSGAGSGNPFGTVNFTSIIQLLLFVQGVASLTFGPGPSNGWTGIFSTGATEKILSPASSYGVSFKSSPTSAGWVTSGSSKVLRITNNGAASVTPTLILVGRS